MSGGPYSQGPAVSGGSATGSFATLVLNGGTATLPLLVNQSPIANPLPGRAGTAVQVVGSDTAATFLTFDNYGHSAAIAMRSAQGTAAAPTAAINGQILFNLSGYAYSGAAFFAAANCSVSGLLLENAGATNAGCCVRIQVAPLGSATQAEAFRADATGLYVGTSGTQKFIDASGIAYLRSYTRATLPTAGYVAGQLVFCSDLGGAGGSLVNTGAAWRRVDPLCGVAADAIATGAETYVYLTDAPIKRYTGSLSNNVTVTLGTADGSAGANTVATGAYLRIVFAGTLNAHTFTVTNGGGGGGSKALTAGQFVDYSFDGTNWTEIAGGTLP